MSGGEVKTKEKAAADPVPGAKRPERRTDKRAEKQPENQTEQPSGVRFGIRLKFSLAIITLVSLLIISITIFFIWRESDILTKQVLDSVNRETVHLANNAQQSIGLDELSMIAAINDLKKISYIKYAFILDKNDAVIQYFDRRKEREMLEPLRDSVDRRLGERAAVDDIRALTVDDPGDARGRIYDFSKTVLNRLDRRKIGTVIIGLSDIVIRDEISTLLTIIIPIALVFLGISIVGSVVLATYTIRPIKALARGTEIIGAGNLDYRLEITSGDELGQLAREFNQMTSKIKDATEKEKEYAIMEEQIEMAREIQEGLNPTGSFKDRGMTTAISVAAARGAKVVICASTGNTSASAAAYATKAGMACAVLVPDGKIAMGKLSQAIAHGATLLQVAGNFDDCLTVARKLAEAYPVELVNSVNPARIEGQKTAAFEIVDALGDAPALHCLPVANACHITPYSQGYQAYAAATPVAPGAPGTGAPPPPLPRI